MRVDFAWRWALLLPIAALYFAGLPTTVQNLDSGELVLSAHSLLLPHPPGYPLYVWLQHAFMMLVPFGTTFWKAALFNSIFVLGGLAILMKIARDWLGVALVLSVATLPMVWRYALIPDVFGLHFLLSTAIIAVYLDAREGARRTLAIMILFGLASANHHTTIFLLPLVLHVLWLDRSWRAFGSAALGALVTVLLYLSILLFNYDAYLNIYEAHTVREVVLHFLRHEYGTFQAKAGSMPAPYLFNLMEGLAALGFVAAGSLLTLGLAFLGRRPDPTLKRKVVLILACTAIYYFLFFAGLNLPPVPPKDAVRERFFIFLAPLLAAGAIRVSDGLSPHKVARGLATVLAFFAIVPAIMSFDSMSLRHDTFIEDYAKNLLATVEKTAEKPALLILDIDTKLYAVRYVQGALGEAPNVVPVGMELTHPSYTSRLRKKWPQLKNTPWSETSKTAWNVDSEFIAPNLGAFDAYHTLHLELRDFKTTYLPIGRKLSAGSGADIWKVPLPIEPRDPMAPGEPMNDRGYMFSEYADIHLAEANLLLAKGDRDGARRALRAGLDLVPYCSECLRQLRQIEQK